MASRPSAIFFLFEACAMTTWHDGPSQPAYLPASDPLAPPLPTAPGIRAATPPAPVRAATLAARSTRTLAAVIKHIIAAPTADDARRVACDGLCAMLRCRDVSLRLLDDAATLDLSPAALPSGWRGAHSGGDAADATMPHIPVLADQQVIGSLVLDRGATARPLAPAARAAAEAVAQVLAQRLAHLRLLALSRGTATSEPPALRVAPAQSVESDAPFAPDDSSLWLAAVCAAQRDAVLLTDAAGRAPLVNHAARRLLGMAGDGVSTSDRGDDLPDRLRRALEPIDLEPIDLEPLEMGERSSTSYAPPSEYPRRFIQRAPVRRILERHDRAVLGGDGTRLGTVITYRDITAEHDAQTRHERFLAAISHALRTPLTSVSGYAQLLRRGLERAEVAPGVDPAAHTRARGYLGALLRQAARINDLLRDMLDVAYLDAQVPPVHSARVDMATLVAGVAESVSANSPHHPVRLRGPRSLLARGDRVDIERIVRHLMENAITFSPAGSAVSFSLRREQTLDSGAVCVLRVRDRGLGIPAGMEEAIFSPPARRDAPGAHHLAGIGLGLRLSRALARRHGGTLRAVPRRRGGAVFELCLPAAGPDDRARTTRRGAP
jgi:signal transduction histidine kinase